MQHATYASSSECCHNILIERRSKTPSYVWGAKTCPLYLARMYMFGHFLHAQTHLYIWTVYTNLTVFNHSVVGKHRKLTCWSKYLIYSKHGAFMDHTYQSQSIGMLNNVKYQYRSCQMANFTTKPATICTTVLCVMCTVWFTQQTSHSHRLKATVNYCMMQQEGLKLKQLSSS